MIKETIYPLDYEKRMEEYNEKVKLLEEQRKKFYEENPNFWSKNMYLNFISPPQKIISREEIKD